jgi:hypothetical protein
LEGKGIYKMEVAYNLFWSFFFAPPAEQFNKEKKGKKRKSPPTAPPSVLGCNGVDDADAQGNTFVPLSYCMLVQVGMLNPVLKRSSKRPPGAVFWDAFFPSFFLLTVPEGRSEAVPEETF